ncbi:unnamed protein product, partial [Allacma fusca]
MTALCPPPPTLAGDNERLTVTLTRTGFSSENWASQTNVAMGNVNYLAKAKVHKIILSKN